MRIPALIAAPVTLGLALGLAGPGLAAPAKAKPRPLVAADAPDAYAGTWTLSGLTEGSGACTIRLTRAQAIGGWRVQIPPPCARRLALPADIAAWSVNQANAILFIDALRAPLLRFRPTGQGDYVAGGEDYEGFNLEKGNTLGK